MEEIRRRAHGEPSGSLFDAFAGLVADACDAPLGVASRIDRSGSWRDAFAVCDPARAIDRAEAFRDETLAASDVVTFDDGVRSYAGVALTSEAGRRFGTIAAIDATGRTFATPERDALRGIGAALVRTIDARRTKSSYDSEQIDMLGAALELVADPIAIFRRRGLGLMPWFVYVNRAFTDLFGYTLDDVVGKEPKILTGPETGTGAREKILAAQGAAPIDYGTLALYTASGRRVLVEMITHHLHPSHRTVSYRDVTRERTAQAALADANQRLSSLVSINSDAIFTFDGAGACVDANPSAEAVTGLTRDALLGTGLHAVAKDGLFPRGERFPSALAEGRALDFTSRLRRRDGASVTVECKAIPIAVRGVTEGAYVFAKDVTESRRLAALVRKQAERATALCAIAALAEETDAEQIDAALELVLDSFGMHYAYVAEFVESELTITSSVGERIYNVADVVKLARKAVSAFHERGEVVTIDDIMRAPDVPSEARRYDGWHAYIFAPLGGGEPGRGALGFVSRDVRAFDDADRDFIRLVASLISSALERRRQNHQLDRLAYFDELSGLPNRAQFRRRLAREGGSCREHLRAALRRPRRFQSAQRPRGSRHRRLGAPRNEPPPRADVPARRHARATGWRRVRRHPSRRAEPARRARVRRAHRRETLATVRLGRRAVRTRRERRRGALSRRRKRRRCADAPRRCGTLPREGSRETPRRGRDRSRRRTAERSGAGGRGALPREDAILTVEIVRGDASSVYATVARLAADICDATLAVVSLADSQQWLEVRRGESLAEIALPREAPLWDETLATSDVLEIADMNADPRFAARAGHSPNLRSYVGTALRDASGDVVGTLCAFDVEPRTLSARRLRALRFVGTSLMTSVETRGDQTSEDLEQIGLLGSALDLVADPIAICRIPERGAARQLLTFVYVNRAFVELFGYASDEILGRTPATLRGPLTEPDVVREFVRAVHTGAEAFGEVTYHSATGEPRIVQVRDRRLGEKYRICSFRDFTRERAAEAALEDTHLRLQALLKTNSDAVFTLDRSGACVDANPAAEALLGYARDELLGDGFAEAARAGLFPEGERFPERLRSGESFAFATSYRHRAGRAIAVDCKAIPMVVRGATEGAYVLATDVTERRRLAELAERQARRAQDLCNVAAATEGAEADRIDSALALVMLSFAMQNAYVAEIRGANISITNRIGERLFDVGGEIEIARTRADELLSLGDVLAIDDLKTHPVINDGIRFDGNWHAYICAPLHVDGKLYGFMGFLGRRVVAFDEGDRDFVRLAAALVSAAIARRVHGVRLDRMAYVDGLTELPNRAHFTRELARETTYGTRPFALLFADLDGFKSLNDRAGHAIGDLALREVGRRIAALCGPAEVPARLGGDEFVILQRENPGRAGAIAFGNAIVEALSAPYVFEGQTFDMGASVGIAFSPEDGTEADTLMRAADAALYRAKTSGKHRVEVTPA